MYNKAGVIKDKEYNHLQTVLFPQLAQTVAVVMGRLGIATWPGMQRETKRKDRVRWLIWLQWSRIYQVPLDQVIETIVVEFRRRLKVTGSRFGMGMPGLTSDKAEAFLVSQLPRMKQVSLEPIPEIPAKYNNLEERIQYAEIARKEIRAPRQRNFRGSRTWRAPEMDAVRKEFTK